MDGVAALGPVQRQRRDLFADLVGDEFVAHAGSMKSERKTVRPDTMKGAGNN